jgi:chorismate lyase/3-hydroxybenzoate synthase
MLRLPPAVPAWASRVPGTQLRSARVADAADRHAGDLSAAVTSAYNRLLAAGLRHPVRFWNFLPGINEPVDDRQSRYMAFNAGRLAAFNDRPVARAATASAVGHWGRDLWVHCLSSDAPATPVDNPRQVQPHRYSARYGPRPPSFARAARLGRSLFVGGTASVLGEDSVHDDLDGQVGETLTNLDAVLAEAGQAFAWGELRAYYVPSVDSTHLRHLLPAAWRVEMVCADLCRPELLVEIEGLAELSEGAEVST